MFVTKGWVACHDFVFNGKISTQIYVKFSLPHFNCQVLRQRILSPALVSAPIKNLSKLLGRFYSIIGSSSTKTPPTAQPRSQRSRSRGFPLRRTYRSVTHRVQNNCWLQSIAPSSCRVLPRCSKHPQFCRLVAYRTCLLHASKPASYSSHPAHLGASIRKSFQSLALPAGPKRCDHG